MKDPEKMKQQLEELQAQNKLMRQLASPLGFYEYFFKQLPNHRTQIECFNAVNELYFDIFGDYRYSNYNSFRYSLIYRKKKK